MRNFMIGMPGGVDYRKFSRDFRDEFFGIEACKFADEAELGSLRELAGDKAIGIHFPILPEDLKCRDPLFLSPSSEEAEKSYEAFEKELSVAARYGADYMLAHFPKPVLLDRSIDWSNWRFGNNHEWMWEDEYPFELFSIKLEEMFLRLSKLEKRYEIKIILEQDFVNRYLNEGTLLIELVERYDNIRLCLDTGRLHLQDAIDPGFDSMEFVRKYAPYTYLVHLWDTTIGGNREGGHFPVMPEHKTEEGWADIAAYMGIIAASNRDVKVMFEHRSDLISDSELQACYDWINSFFR